MSTSTIDNARAKIAEVLDRENEMIENEILMLSILVSDPETIKKLLYDKRANPMSCYSQLMVRARHRQDEVIIELLKKYYRERWI